MGLHLVGLATDMAHAAFRPLTLRPTRAHAMLSRHMPAKAATFAFMGMRSYVQLHAIGITRRLHVRNQFDRQWWGERGC